jgi:hypothetical protein
VNGCYCKPKREKIDRGILLIFFACIRVSKKEEKKRMMERKRKPKKIPHLAFLSRVNKQQYYVFAEKCNVCTLV